MTASQGRLLIYSTFGIAMTALVGLTRWYGDFGDAPFLLQMATAGTGVAWAGFIGVDVAFHSLTGRGTPCPRCGHTRHLRSFRLASPCPKCGE